MSEPSIERRGWRPWRELFAELLSPLMLSAYVAWAAVWFSAVGPIAQRDAGDGWLARGALLVFLAAFMAAGHGASDRLTVRFGLLAGTQVLAAFAVIGLGPSGSTPILLVLVAGMLAAHLGTMALVVALLAINVALLLTMRFAWQAGWPHIGIVLAAFASFQGFAALVMANARRAQAMAEQLGALNAELLATRALLEQSTRDAERLRLSRELHDVSGHALTALKLNLGALARDARQPDPQRVALCAGLADELLQNLRGVVRQMREQQGLDLAAAIARLAAPFPRPELHLEVDPTLRFERIDVIEAVLRTVQEGLTNAARHSNARHLWVVLQRDGARLRLELRDDGRGGDGIVFGNGLNGMRERLQALGGGLDFERSGAGGLALHAWLPPEVLA